MNILDFLNLSSNIWIFAPKVHFLLISKAILSFRKRNLASHAKDNLFIALYLIWYAFVLSIQSTVEFYKANVNLLWPLKWNARTVFENHSKCRIWIFQFWHFPLFFVLLKVTCLVTLFDCNLQVFKNSPNGPFLAF